MTMKRLHFVVLLCAMVLYQVGPAQEAATAPPIAEGTATKPELNPELKLARDALLDRGSSEQMRTTGATVLLRSEEPQAREILLEALKQSENEPVRVAVCKVLSQRRTAQQAIPNKAQFIGPVLGVLADDNDSLARLAAEATLIFDYDQVAEPLEKLLFDESAPIEHRLNAVYVLEMHPDMRVAVKLLELIDNPEPLLGARARVALNVLGVEIGSDAEDRSGIINKLQGEGQEAYLRERLIRRRSEIYSKTAEADLWRERYLSAQDQVCDGISDDTEKGKFLAQHLGSGETVRKLWALEKLRSLRVAGKTTPKLTAEVAGGLVALISDSDGPVRLKTAELLSLMGQVNSAERLLAQLEVEKDTEVKAAVFSALGGACHYAFLPTSSFKIAPEIRKQTLKWAETFLFDPDPAKSQKGAVVLGRLVEQDGLTEDESKDYLGMLVRRYSQKENPPDATLRGELIGAMASLCAQGAHVAQARELFEPVFAESIADKTDRVRERAVDGLVYINKAAALERLRDNFYNDPSARVRRKMVDLAAEVGGKADLPFLVKKIGSNGESEPAWRAMMKIFSGSDAGVLAEWVGTLTALDKDSRPTPEQMMAFLELAELKITSQKGAAVLEKAREHLAALYVDSAQFEKAASCWQKLRESAVEPERKEHFTQALLETYLQGQKPTMAATLIGEALETSDLDPNNILVQSLDKHLSKPPAGTDPNGVYEALATLKASQERPKWQQWLKAWALRLAGAKSVDKPAVATPKPEEG